MKKDQDIHSEFMTCYKSNHRQLNAYCLAISNNLDDAKDLMSNTLEIAFKKFETLKDKTQFKYYLFAIASRLRNNEKRKSLNKTFVSEEFLMNISHKENETDRLVDLHFLHQALQSIDTESREALILFEIEGFSIKEIAEIQNLNENTIKSRLSRGREKLKTVLNPDYKKASNQ